MCANSDGLELEFVKRRKQSLWEIFYTLLVSGVSVSSISNFHYCRCYFPHPGSHFTEILNETFHRIMLVWMDVCKYNIKVIFTWIVTGVEKQWNAIVINVFYYILILILNIFFFYRFSWRHLESQNKMSQKQDIVINLS